LEVCRWKVSPAMCFQIQRMRAGDFIKNIKITIIYNFQQEVFLHCCPPTCQCPLTQNVFCTTQRVATFGGQEKTPWGTPWHWGRSVG
jgi:hypothetical protein